MYKPLTMYMLTSVSIVNGANIYRHKCNCILFFGRKNINTGITLEPPVRRTPATKTLYYYSIPQQHTSQQR